METMKKLVLNGTEYALTDTGAVRFDGPQALTEAQKSQAAQNIGAVANPGTATVGQTMTVKSVDENGKPTEWECVDLPGESQYELIETITMEAAGHILRTGEPDGTAYHFSALFFHVVVPAGETVTSGSFIFYHADATDYIAHRWTAAATADATSALIYHGRIYRDQGIWCWTLPGNFGKNGASPILYDDVREDAANMVNEDTITKLYFTQTFPVGTVIHIYGVRA